MRRWLVVLAAVTVAAAVPLAVYAASGGFSSRLDAQHAVWSTNLVSTTSPAWTDVPGFSAIHVCAGDQTSPEVSLVLSVNLQGAPVRFQVVEDGGPVLQPGAARFVPGAAAESFSYTFVGRTSRFENSDQHSFEVQWSSPTGGRATMTRGDVNVLFQQGSMC
jgi:hypothetical protein